MKIKSFFKRKSKIKNLDPDDIFNIHPSSKKIFLASILSFIIGSILSWIFYKVLILSIIFGFLSIFSVKFYKEKYKKKIEEQIEDEFYDINMLLVAELESGIPINTAIRNIRREINTSPIYKFEYMEKELNLWTKKMGMGMKIEEIILDFSIRSENESLIEYANLIKICSSKGGSLKDIISNTNEVLSEKRQLKRDIEVLIAEKKLEQKVMNLMPIAVLVMLQKSAPEFIEPLYTNLAGRITMTVLLIIFSISYFWSAKLSSLE